MPIPDFQSLMLPVLVAASKGEVRIGSVVEQLADQLGLTPQERSELLPSGKQTMFSNRVHWGEILSKKSSPRRATTSRTLQNYPTRADGPRAALHEPRLAFEAAELANRASGIVVGKLGTATVTVGELEANLSKPPAQGRHHFTPFTR
jgi:restriction endonuclease Mrr